MTDLTYISRGNDKTDCFSFDLPAKLTCPGMTKTCGDKCYAAQLMRIYSNVDAKYARNLEFANSAEFIAHMIREIPRRCEFRIHVSGDFKDAAYVLDWIAIASKRTDVVFYAYTRSWSIPKIWVAVRALAELPNVNINLSCDNESGEPDCIDASSYRWAYLTHAKEYQDAPEWLRRSDIVFRSCYSGHKKRRKNAEKKGLDPNVVAPMVSRIGDAPVCPFERGKELKSFSCSRCQICIQKPKVAIVNAS
jgi:hypothetical protein